MTYTPHELAGRIVSKLDSATYELGKERETRVAIIEAEIAAMFRMSEANAEAVQGWIPCDELLPGLGMCVLLARGKESVSGKVVGCTTQYNVRLDQGDRILTVSTKAYRHWQPLPQPPEAAT